MYIKLLNKYHQKKKASKKKHVKDVKIFVKKKKKKGKKKDQDRFKSIFEEEKGKSISIIMIEIRSLL